MTESSNDETTYAEPAPTSSLPESPEASIEPVPDPKRSVVRRATWLQKSWDLSQLFVSVGIVGAALVWMLRSDHTQETANETNNAIETSAIDVSEDGFILVSRESPLGERLNVTRVEPIETTDPLMKVTGLVIASRRPGRDGNEDFWQFHSDELLTTFSDWERARADVDFNQSRIEQVRSLGVATEKGLNTAIARMEKLVQTGTETAKDLENLRTQLVQAQLQSQKDIYEAETATKIARKAVDTLGLRLSRYGLDGTFLANATADMDILAVEVPEGRLGKVQQGQKVRARFFGLADADIEGIVQTVSPVLSTDQRTLRVIVLLNDPLDRLRPGMYANVDLGINPRRVIQIPATSLLHVGTLDYVLIDSSSEHRNEKDITSSISAPTMYSLLPQVVDVGDASNGTVTIEKGLVEGMHFVDAHAVLLKPLVTRSLRVLRLASGEHQLNDEMTEGQQR